MDNTKKYTSRQKSYFALLVNIVVPLAAMSTDIYLPSLPALNLHFHSQIALVQLTVTSYIIAMGLSQFIAGPVSDACGRKGLLLIAIVTQFLAVLAIIFSPSIYWMIVFRFVQGLGAAFMIVPGRAIINDVFEGHELKKQFNYTTISFAVSPIVAPFIGGYLQHYLGWQANFFFILIYTALLGLLLLLSYKETIMRTRSFSMHYLWENYRIILSNRYFVVSAIFAGMIWGYAALFSITGPFLIQTELHHSAIAYGRVALLMGLAWFLGNAANRLLFNTDKKVKSQVSLWLTLVTAIVMIVLSHLGFFSIPALAIPASVIIFFSGIMFPIYIGECMVIFSNLAASANACLFGIIWIMFGGYTVLATQLKVHSMFPLAVSFGIVGILCLLLYYGVIKKIVLKPRNC